MCVGLLIFTLDLITVTKTFPRRLKLNAIGLMFAPVVLGGTERTRQGKQRGVLGP